MNDENKTLTIETLQRITRELKPLERDFVIAVVNTETVEEMKALLSPSDSPAPVSAGFEVIALAQMPKDQSLAFKSKSAAYDFVKCVEDAVKRGQDPKSFIDLFLRAAKK